ncbi:MAG: serine/threonine-protein kinase [Archangium sp.]|nr:serine/threonine-protein kinase [Archangium sp.]
MGSDRETSLDRPASSEAATPTPSTAPANCPECGKQLEGEPNYCPACGADLRGLSGDSDTLDGPLKEKLIDNRYRVLEKLGEGGMGAVYKVEHVRMGKLAALKLMRPDHALDKALKGRFLQEARVVARLSHPNTVQVFDSGELEDGSLFIAMEFVPGKDLAWQLKAHGPLGEGQAATIGVQLLSSLQEAHEAGIIHRDLKPANVMLVRRRKSGDDQVKLLDFGIAKLQEAEGRKSTTGDFIGTPAYMSPEQIRGESLDARSDLYSLGCLLFELVSGRQPFEGPTPISILTQHYEAPIPRVTEVKRDANISPAFQGVLDKAMAKRATDRWPDAEAMRVALEQLQKSLGSKPAEYTPMPVELSDKMLSREDFDQFERQLKLRRSLAPFIALLVLAVAGLAGVKLLRSAGTEVVSGRELEPNDQVQQATHIPLGAAVQGAIGASAGEGDRDLYVATVAAGPHRFTLSGVADLNLAVEVLQLEKQQKDDGTTNGEKLVRKLFLDDNGPGEPERVDGLQLSAGEVFFRVVERPFCTEPNRPSREKSLVPYTLVLEPLTTEALAEVEPNDTPSTAQSLPFTRAVLAWAGDRVDLEKLGPMRPDAPFSASDWFRVDGPADALVMVAVVPPERGVLLVVDGSALEAFQKRTLKTLPVVTVKGVPQWVEIKPMTDGQRRLRVLAGDELLPGSEFWLAAGMGGDNGLAAVVDLGRLLESRSRLETRRLLLDATRQRFAGSSDLTRLGEN